MHRTQRGRVAPKRNPRRALLITIGVLLSIIIFVGGYLLLTIRIIGEGEWMSYRDEATWTHLQVQVAAVSEVNAIMFVPTQTGTQVVETSPGSVIAIQQPDDSFLVYADILAVRAGQNPGEGYIVVHNRLWPGRTNTPPSEPGQ